MLFVCSGGYVSYWDMQNDEKCKNDNLLSDQVLVLLMFSNVVMEENVSSENCCPLDVYFTERC